MHAALQMLAGSVCQLNRIRYRNLVTLSYAQPTTQNVFQATNLERARFSRDNFVIKLTGHSDPFVTFRVDFINIIIRNISNGHHSEMHE
jgi:hypothetical protein